jgi:hypothetical protein
MKPNITKIKIIIFFWNNFTTASKIQLLHWSLFVFPSAKNPTVAKLD